ncbi:hypothetical protein JTB14_021838 [Gonioctena quinquepunctata]|nr:hypothetical protein JTB14_021838 [Gonioctena quinquepunctata]
MCSEDGTITVLRIALITLNVLIFYAVICILLCIVQGVLAIVSFVTVHKVPILTENVDLELEKYYFNNAEKVATLQKKLECCGRNGTGDPYVQIGDTLIDSCCGNGAQPCTEENAYVIGCTSALIKWIQVCVRRIGIISAVFSLVELPSAILAICMKALGDEEE